MFNFIATRINVLGKTVFLGVVASNSGSEVIAQRNVDSALSHRMSALTNIELDIPALTIGVSLGGVDTECTGDGVTAKQEALWAAQNFDPIDVIETGHCAAVSAFVKVVFEKAGRGVATHAKILIAHTTNRDGINV